MNTLEDLELVLKGQGGGSLKAYNAWVDARDRLRDLLTPSEDALVIASMAQLCANVSAHYVSHEEIAQRIEAYAAQKSAKLSEQLRLANIDALLTEAEANELRDANIALQKRVEALEAKLSRTDQMRMDT